MNKSIKSLAVGTFLMLNTACTPIHESQGTTRGLVNGEEAMQLCMVGGGSLPTEQELLDSTNAGADITENHLILGYDGRITFFDKVSLSARGPYYGETAVFLCIERAHLPNQVEA